MSERRAAVIAQLTELQCGLCLREGKEERIRATYALERMMAMLNHWNNAHGDSVVPAFTQDTWRTGIVYPLSYTPTHTLTSEQMAAQSSGIYATMRVLKDDIKSDTPMVLTMEPASVKAQIMVREMREWPSQRKTRYQCYVRIANKKEVASSKPTYLSPRRTLQEARLDSTQLQTVLNEALGADNVTMLDYC